MLDNLFTPAMSVMIGISMSPKSTADEALVARNRATAIATIKGYNKVADLKAFLK